ADETLPEHPGADSNTADAADTTMKDEGYASAQETVANGTAAAGDTSGNPAGTSSAPGAAVNPGAATTTMHTMDEAANKPNPSTNKLAGMTSDELVDKPVKD